MGMATFVLRNISVDQNLTPQLPQRPENAYLPNHDLERGLPGLAAPLPTMESFGMRQRAPGTTSAGEDAGSSSASPTTLTPSSSRDDENTTEVPRLRHEVWPRLAGFVPNPFSRRSATEESEGDSNQDKDKPLKYEKVDDFPEGWPRLAAQMNSDDVFTNYRRFGRLSSRLLLHRQNDLMALEERIDELDRADAIDPTMKYRLRGKENYHGWDSAQRDLIEKTRVSYMEYSDLLLRKFQLRALDDTTQRNHRQLLQYVLGNKPLGSGKYDFIFEVEDFVSLGKRSANERYFEDLIETLLDKSPTARYILKKFLVTDRERKKASDEFADSYNPVQLSILGNSLVVLLTVGGIAVPVLLLVLQTMNRALMVTVALLFVVLFSVSVAGMTGARVQDIMFGTAAYSALGITLLQNASQCSCGK